MQVKGKPNQLNSPYSPLLCLIFPHIHMWMFGELWSAYATLAISVERAISVFQPMWYSGNWKKGASRKYVKGWLVFTLLYATVYYVIVFARDQSNSRLKCTSFDTIGPEAMQFSNALRLTVGFLAAFVTFVAVMKGKSVLSSHGGLDNEKEARLNRTAVAVVITTMVLDMLPSMFLVFNAGSKIWSDHATRQLMNALIYGVRMSNAVINFPLYYVINKDFRDTVKYVFGGGSSNEASKNYAKSVTRQSAAA